MVTKMAAIKTWNGKEDNEVLAQILEQELDFDTIYKN